MNSSHRTGVSAGAVVAIALVLGACGGGSNPTARSNATTSTTVAAGSTSASTTTTAAGPSTTGVDPNAPEVSPAGDIPDNQVFIDYSPPSAGYHVKVPEGWARSEQGGAVIFT